jgi:hypothetical protein
VYQAKSGAIELRGDFGKETIWANQKQIADIFNIERSVATKHISNILKIKEVDQKSNVQKMHIANSDKPVVYYSLDVILAVGYRTNSYRAIQFRQWATKTLRQYITHGFAINKKRIAEHYSEFQKVVEDMKNLFPPGATIDSDSVLELISAFADTWFSLDAYDKDALVTTGATKKSVSLTAKQLAGALLEFKQELMRKKQATDIFGQERSVDSIGQELLRFSAVLRRTLESEVFSVAPHLEKSGRTIGANDWKPILAVFELPRLRSFRLMRPSMPLPEM